MFPINLSVDRLNHLAATFNCQSGSLPFTYLGLPLSLTKPNAVDCFPLVMRIERRLVNTLNLLTQRREVTNGKLSFLIFAYFLYVLNLSSS
jgi:hypothetical protein